MSDCEHDIDIDTSMTRLRCVKCGLDANVITIRDLEKQILELKELVKIARDCFVEKDYPTNIEKEWLKRSEEVLNEDRN